MKSFVVLTFYQLQHAIAMALTFEEKPSLFFNCSYLDIQDGLINRIKETGIFNSVTEITKPGDLNSFIVDLNKTKDYSIDKIDEIGNAIFEKHLEPYYADLFSNADFNDTIYVYNDFQWEFYYINKHFSDIVGVEDGYASLKQQISTHRLKGNHRLVINFLGKYYPEPLYKSSKIHTILSSKYFLDIPIEYKSRLQLLDFNKLVDLNYERFCKALFYIFNMEHYEVSDNSILFLAQPLARAGYCTPIQEYLLNKKILRSYRSQTCDIYYKAHPADRTDPEVYGEDGIKLLPKNFPVELLNYKKCTFNKVISFASTGVDTINNAKSHDKVYGSSDNDKDKISEFIDQFTKNEKVRLCICFLVNNMNTEVFINVYSGFVYENKNFISESVVAVSPKKTNEAKSFFCKNNMLNMIEKHKQTYKYKGVSIREDKLFKIETLLGNVETPRVISCDGVDDDSLIKLIKQLHGNYDYILIVDEKNYMTSVVSNIWKELNYRFQSYIVFPNHTGITYRTNFPWVNIGPGYIGDIISGNIMNRVWHQSIIDKFCHMNEEERVRFLMGFKATARKFTNSLYAPPESYTSIIDGLEYYVDRINFYLCDSKIDDNVKIAMASMEVYSYIDWCQVTDNKLSSETLRKFVKNIKTTSQIKEEILERLTITLLFENNNRFRMLFNEQNSFNNKNYVKYKKVVSKLKTFLKKIRVKR